MLFVVAFIIVAPWSLSLCFFYDSPGNLATNVEARTNGTQTKMVRAQIERPKRARDKAARTHKCKLQTKQLTKTQG